MILKFTKGADRLARAVHLARDQAARRPNPTTLVIHYDKAVANVLPQLQQFFVLPRHVWEPIVGSERQGPQGLRPGRAPADRGRRLLLRHEVRQEGHDDPRAQPRLLRPASRTSTPSASRGSRTPTRCSPRSRATTSTTSTRCRRPSRRTLGKSGDIQVVTGQGIEVRDFGFNSNPKKKKNRELLDPKVRDALSHAFDRKQIIDVVFRGLAEPRATLLTPISAPYMNTDLQPEKYDLALANSMLDKLGYKRGSDGIRRTPGANSHPMSYGVITPTSVAGINREFAIVRDSFQKIGVKLTQRAYDGDDGVRRDHEAEEPVPRLRHDDVGLGRLRRSRLHALGRRLRPVRRLERHGLLQPGLRQALPAAGRHARPGQAAGRSSGRCRRSSTATSRTSSSRSCSWSTASARAGRASTRPS